jgi:tetratricopeptide (TPR) repeat protein
VALTYTPVLRAQFVYDDLWMVVRNPALRSVTPGLFFTDPRTVAAPESGLATDIYRPLTTLSLALTYRMAGLRSLPYHAENVFWHLLNGLWVWLFLRRFLRHEAGAFLGTFVFLLHPVQVQTVAWVSQRSNVLGGFAFLASLWCLSGEHLPRRRFLLGAALFAAGLFCRETVITLLPILALLDLRTAATLDGPHQRLFSPLPKYGLLVLISIIYLGLRHHLLHQWSQFNENSSSIENIANGLLAFPVYVGKLVVPIRLRPSYGYPNPGITNLGVAIVFALGYLTALRVLWRKLPDVSQSLGWILISVLPVLQILPIRTFFAERFLYVSVVGLAIGAGSLYREFPFTWRALWIWALVLAALTAARVPVWKTDQTLWADAIRQEPSNAFAHACYAESVPDPFLAERHYKLALMNHPAAGIRFAAVNNLAWLYRQQKQPRRALIWAKEAVREKPGDARALYNLCQIELDLGMIRTCKRWPR